MLWRARGRAQGLWYRRARERERSVMPFSVCRRVVKWVLKLGEVGYSISALCPSGRQGQGYCTDGTCAESCKLTTVAIELLLSYCIFGC